MSSILYNIVIAPIELVVEVVFELVFRLVGRGETNQGIAVIGVSVAISLLTLPLYRRADMVQQKERDTQQKLAYRVNRIKKAFKGDERFMMLQTYYSENNYSPLYALRGMLSLLLEIPFFIAAYHFLSHLEVLRGASFGFITDLGKPDGLIHLYRWGGGISKPAPHSDDRHKLRVGGGLPAGLPTARQSADLRHGTDFPCPSVQFAVRSCGVLDVQQHLLARKEHIL